MADPTPENKTDNQPADNQPTDNQPTDNSADEQKFWQKFETTVDKKLNDFFEKKRAELFPPKSNRNGGRKTLPDIIADAMFGKPSDKQ